MTNRSKFIIVGVASFFAGVTIGGAACLMLFADPKKFFSDIGQVHMMTQFAHGQYAQAEYPHNRDALHQYVTYLNSYRVEKNSWLSEDVVLFDKAMTYARLAILEEQHGSPTSADEYWVKAEEYASRSHWKAKDRLRMREFVQRLDRKDK